MSTQELVSDAVERVIMGQRLAEGGAIAYDDGGPVRPEGLTAMNIRFDFEVPDDWSVSWIEQLRRSLVPDLVDLVVNGDIKATNDALLKAFDGEAKRGQKASMVNISRSSIFWAYKPQKSTTEYTVYIVINVEFEGEKDEAQGS